jgi:hypothetical protein
VSETETALLPVSFVNSFWKYVQVRLASRARLGRPFLWSLDRPRGPVFPVPSEHINAAQRTRQNRDSNANMAKS